jgi:hypothetical protein
LWSDAETARDAPSNEPTRYKDLICVECRRVDRYGRGWRAIPDGAEVQTYCPNCAKRELGRE